MHVRLLAAWMPQEIKWSPLLSTSDLPFPRRHVLHNAYQALLLPFPCPHPTEGGTLLIINTLTVMISKTDEPARPGWYL